MEIEKPHLFLEINEKNFIFLVVKYDEDFNFKVIYSHSIKSEGILDGKITNIESSSKIIKDCLNLVEKKVGFIFTNVTVINDQDNFSCINISGFKKLGGSQILDEDISYLLNNIKKLILDNHSDKSLIHLFNSNFFLDHNVAKDPPIGLHGDFYNQHLTFFLLPKNGLKNLKMLLNKCNLNIEKIVLKSFTQGIQKIIKTNFKETFAIINFGKNKSNISIFNNLSFVYSESFYFGTDTMMKDVSKVCSLNSTNVENIFSQLNFDFLADDKKEKYLEKSYFKDETFRKISLNHIKDIIMARAEELVNLVYKKNINLENLRNEVKIVYLSFEDQNILKNLKKSFRIIFLDKGKNIEIQEETPDEQLASCLASAELKGKGWEREAIPTIQTKKSIISKIFSTFFK